jgi:phenylpyruvate tautomerase PptA (4-oxalocrotonate tautomerase family)
MPKIDSTTKERLASALTEAFAQSTPFGADIFGIRFFEYEPGTTAVGGRIQAAAGTENPYLHFLLYCPRIKRTTKQKIATSLTQAFTLATGRSTWLPVIHICEHPYDNVVVNGKLLSDAYEECAKRSFYYELPKE